MLLQVMGVRLCVQIIRTTLARQFAPLYFTGWNEKKKKPFESFDYFKYYKMWSLNLILTFLKKYYFEVNDKSWYSINRGRERETDFVSSTLPLQMFIFSVIWYLDSYNDVSVRWFLYLVATFHFLIGWENEMKATKESKSFYSFWSRKRKILTRFVASRIFW